MPESLTADLIELRDTCQAFAATHLVGSDSSTEPARRFAVQRNLPACSGLPSLPSKTKRLLNWRYASLEKLSLLPTRIIWTVFSAPALGSLAA